MGIFERFERRVEGAVSGAFARAFKGDVQPVEIAARLQRELDGEAKLVSRDKRLVPNEFIVGLSEHDHDKLTPYAQTLLAELEGDLRTHAREMGYVFNGPVRIHLELNSRLPTGRFTVESEAVAGAEAPAVPSGGPRAAPARRAPEPAASAYAPPTPAYAPPTPAYAAPASAAPLVLEVNGTQHPLTPPGLTIGRGSDADLRIDDPGVSRLHAEIRVSEHGVEIVDLGSTNGIVLDGHKIGQAALRDGSRLEIGSTRMLVHTRPAR